MNFAHINFGLHLIDMVCLWIMLLMEVAFFCYFSFDLIFRNIINGSIRTPMYGSLLRRAALMCRPLTPNEDNHLMLADNAIIA